MSDIYVRQRWRRALDGSEPRVTRLSRRQVLKRQSPKMTEVLGGRHLRSLTRAQRDQLLALVEIEGYDIDDPEFRVRVRRVIAE